MALCTVFFFEKCSMHCFGKMLWLSAVPWYEKFQVTTSDAVTGQLAACMQPYSEACKQSSVILIDSAVAFLDHLTYHLLSKKTY